MHAWLVDAARGDRAGRSDRPGGQCRGALGRGARQGGRDRFAPRHRPGRGTLRRRARRAVWSRRDPPAQGRRRGTGAAGVARVVHGRGGRALSHGDAGQPRVRGRGSGRARGPARLRAASGSTTRCRRPASTSTASTRRARSTRSAPTWSCTSSRDACSSRPPPTWASSPGSPASSACGRRFAGAPITPVRRRWTIVATRSRAPREPCSSCASAPRVTAGCSGSRSASWPRSRAASTSSPAACEFSIDVRAGRRTTTSSRRTSGSQRCCSASPARSSWHAIWCRRTGSRRTTSTSASWPRCDRPPRPRMLARST